jgi:7-carboxy-7-deazaguanine synthase
MVTPRINELFGPTFQGEGPFTGRRCSFVRFALCNLTCSWCDTPYTWDWNGRNGIAYNKADEVHPTSIHDIMDRLATHGTDLVILTGGEPLVQASAHHELVTELVGHGYTVQTETNGTLIPAGQLATPNEQIHWSVSPKLDSAGMSVDQTIIPAALQWFAAQPNATFKFVVTDLAAVKQTAKLVNRYNLPHNRVWLMPEGITAEAIQTALPDVAAAALDHGYQLSSRLHVTTWGDQRGV